MDKTKRKKKKLHQVTIRKECVICKRKIVMPRGSSICGGCYKKGHSMTNRKRNRQVVEWLEKNDPGLLEDILDSL